MQTADRFILNVLSNYVLTFVAGVAGLVMIPVVLADLGAAGFGLAALLQAGFVIIQTLSDSIGRALQRYMPRDLAGPDPQHVNVTFSSGRACYAVFGVVGALGIWTFRGVYLDAPELGSDQALEVMLAVILVVASTALGLFLNSYRAGLEALQRYDLVSPRVGLAMALRAILVIALFKLGHGSIMLFVASFIAATLATGLWFRRTLRRELPLLREPAHRVQPSALRPLAMFAATTMLIPVGNMLGTEGFRFMIGKTLGMAQVGMLSALLAFRTMASTLIENMSNVIAPTVSTLEAQGRSRRLGPFLVSTTKYATVAASLVCVVPLPVANSFLGLWLGDEARAFAPVMFTILIAQIPLLVSASAQMVLVGLGRTHLAGSTVSLRGIVSLAAAFLYVVLTVEPSLVGATFCLYAVQAAGGLTMLVFGARATGTGVLVLFRDALLLPLSLALIGAGATALASFAIGSADWLELVICVGAGEAAFVVVAGWLAVDAAERRRVQGFALRAWRWARTRPFSV